MSERRYVCDECRGVYRQHFARCPLDGGRVEARRDDPMVGTTIAGRYDVEALVGEGSMGRVYRARHAYLSRHFAVKVLFGELTADATMRMRFAQEAEAGSRLRHPNLVSVLDFGRTEGGLLYMALDFVEGASLATLIEREGPLDEDRVVRIARQLCRGLQHAHERGLVHRDLKPDNVVLVKDGPAEVPSILDFGLAISVSPEEASPRLTARGLVIGTPAYISPEQVRQQPIDHRADLYALGMMIYAMLAGRPAFDGNSIETAAMNVTLRPPPLAERTPGVRVSPALEALVFRLLEKHPDDRLPSAATVLAALDAIGAVDDEGWLDLELQDDTAAPPLRRRPDGSLELDVDVPFCTDGIAPVDLGALIPFRYA